MKEERFIQKNMPRWQELEQYNIILAKKGIKGLNKDEMKAFIALYRALSHQLSYARTYFPQSNIIVYLNQLIGTSHNYIFTREKNSGRNFKYYLTRGFKNHLKQYSSYLAASTMIFLAGMLLCFLLVLVNPEWGDFFFPGVEVESLNLTPEENLDSWVYPLFSSVIMTNNIRVCLLSFALGITAGIGTCYILLYNGMVIGALLGIIVRGGGDVLGFWAMILPHGFIELTAIFISGAAGLLIGKKLLIPGPMKRKDSAIEGAKQAAYFIPGIVLMLVIAGIIEGFFTPLAISPIIKLVFAFATFIVMILYYILPLGRVKSRENFLAPLTRKTVPADADTH